MAKHTTEDAAAFTALAAATSAALGYTVAWTGVTAPDGEPNSMIDTTWTVEDSAADAIPFSASYEDLDTDSDENKSLAVVQRALGIDALGSVLQANFAAAAVVVAAADAPDAHTAVWNEMQDLDPDILGLKS